jgi:hypothetical protein
MEVLQRDEFGVPTLWQRTVRGEWVETIQTPTKATYPRTTVGEAQAIMDRNQIDQILDKGNLRYLGTMQPEASETLDWIVLQRDEEGRPVKILRIVTGTFAQLFSVQQ